MMRLIVGIPMLLLLVLFALSNTQLVRLGLWPTDWQVELPLAVAILVGMGIAFLAGGLIVWFGAHGERRRLKDAERTIRLLESRLPQSRGGADPGAEP